MDIKAVINEKYLDMEIHVCNHEMNGDVKEMVDSLSKYLDNNYAAKNDKGDQVLIRLGDIVSVYAEVAKVYIHTQEGNFEAAKKLYEFEKELDPNKFLRISKSEIVCLKKIKKLDMGMTGTIKVCMNDGYECYTSRRNVTVLKKALGI